MSVGSFARVRTALTTLPRAADWRRTLTELLWLAPALAALGWLGDLVGAAPRETQSFLPFLPVAFFVPAVAEEVVFRAALLPAPNSKPSVLRCALGIAAFVAWHPLQVLWFGQAWAEVVLNPWFLVAVALLGVATTRLYLATSSLWPSVAVHWIVVVVWKLLGGASPWT